MDRPPVHLHAIRGAEHGIDLPEFADFWEEGGVDIPQGGTVLLEAFRADPVAHPLETPSGLIELFSATIDGFGYDDCPGHPAWLEPTEWLGAADAPAGSLHLVSNQPAHRLHSQLDMRRRAGRRSAAANPADSIPPTPPPAASPTATSSVSSTTAAPAWPACA